MVPSKEVIDGETTAVATYTLPDIIRRVRATNKEHGILFLDEFSQASHDMQKAVAQLILDREVNGFSLPDGWWIVAASNRTADKAGVNRLLTHVTNRFRVLPIVSSVEDWSNWALDNSLNSMAVAFARFKPGAVFSDEVPSKPGPFPTPRSYVAAIEYLQAIAGDDPDAPLPVDPLSVEVISGSIGEGAAAELTAFLKTNEFLPTREELIANPKKAKLPPEDRLDASYAAVQMAVSCGIENKTDMDIVDKCFTYCSRLPLELQTMAARDLVRNAGGSALNAKSVVDFMAKHKGLILNSI
jgi:MoxR-like ATPase